MTKRQQSERESGNQRPADPAYRLTWEQALAWRMARHHLVARAAPPDLVRVVGDICGLHAQLASSAELSLWARIDGLARGAVDEALWQRRALVKLWAMRGTLHLLPSAELGLWLAAIGTYTHYGNKWPEMDVLAETISEVLRDRPLTREELAVAVERRTGEPKYGEWVRFSWGSYLKATAFRGLLCFADSQDGRVRFTSPPSWVPGALDRPDPLQARRAIIRRFLAAYAPLTAQDLARWWIGGAGAAYGKRLLAALDEEAVEVDVEGESLWVLAEDISAMAQTEPGNVARLLPAFDPWVAGASRSNAVLLDSQYRARVYRNQGWISPVVLVNGRMGGVWRHRRRGRRLLVEVEPFGTFPAWARAQVEAEAERLAAFFDCGLDLRMS